MRYVIDRIEENSIAVCEDESGKTVLLQIEKLPDDAREGSVIFADDNGVFHCDESDEKRRRRNNFLLSQELFDE